MAVVSTPTAPGRGDDFQINTLATKDLETRRALVKYDVKNMLTKEGLEEVFLSVLLLFCPLLPPHHTLEKDPLWRTRCDTHKQIPHSLGALQMPPPVAFKVK